MARKSGNSKDLNLNQLLNVLLQLVSGNPGSGLTKGRIWFDSSANVVKYHDGTTTQIVSILDTEAVQDIIGAFFGDTSTLDVTYNDAGNAISAAVLDSPLLGGQNSAYHRARANHTGTQLAATISDFDTQVRLSRLDQMAAPTASVSLNSQKITNLLDPTSAQDAATKGYVDNAVNGFDWKKSVRVATTANGTLASAYANGSTVDGVTLVTGDRILLKNQTSGSENGIYTVNASGAPTRATDADASAEVTPGLAVFVEEGTANGNQQWVLTTDAPITLGTTALVFAQVGATGSAYAAGAGLTSASNTYNVGAGTGIVVNADDVAIDTSVVSRKISFTITGDGTTTAFALTHSLGTRDVIVSEPYDTSTSPTYEEWDAPDVVHTSTSVVTLTFSPAPPSGQNFRVTVMG